MSSAIDTVVDAGLGRRRRVGSPEPATELTEPRRERCPRCSSLDTKFCYYNNYNTSQPRHFCKSCRRYWTLGGSLRNVPVGGSSRKRLRTSVPPGPAMPHNTATSAPLAPRHFEVGLGPLPLGFPLALGDTLLDGRVGFDLGLGLGVGPGPLLWSPSLLEEEVVSGDSWRMESGGDYFGAAAAAVWKDMGYSGTVDGGSGGVGASERKVH